MSRCTRRARTRDRLWSACLITVAGLPVTAFLLPHLRLMTAPISFAFDAGEAESIAGPMATWLARFWLLGTAVLSLRLAAGVAQLFRLLKTASPLPEDVKIRLQDRLTAETSAAWGDVFQVGHRDAALWVSDRIGSPSCWQLHRPLIVLPDTVLRFPDDELALIVRHELIHLRACHPLLLFIQRLVEIVFWFHPAAWWASRQVERSREFRCDEESVTTRPMAASYVRSLLRLISSKRPAAPLATALGFGSGKSLIVERAERLAARDWSSPAPRLRSWTVAIPVACGLLAMLMVWPPAGAASRRSLWSPWPASTARALNAIGVTVRDYEVDGHRLRPQELTQRRRAPN